MDRRGCAEGPAEAIRAGRRSGRARRRWRFGFQRVALALHDHEMQFCAFDILAEGGDDLRMLPLSVRKASLERLLARRPEGVFVNPFERGEFGPDDLFRAACNMGLEGLVSKRRDRPYEGGRCRYWIKVKNRKHPAMEREL
nr:hypothetical protein [Bradyrhizobium sp. NC92]